MSLLLLSLLTGAALAVDDTGPWEVMQPASEWLSGQNTRGTGLAGKDYLIGAGDVLRVQVYGERGLSGDFPVDDDGTVSLPLVGRVEVAGQNAARAAARLTEALSQGYLVAPNVSVWVESYRSQPVQVMGAVKQPGVVHLRGPTTLLDVLTQAGGVLPAGVDEVRVTRAAQGGAIVTVPYDPLVEQGVGNLELAGGDVVFIPARVVSVLGEVGKPGDVPFREGLTVATVVAAAGGSEATANLRRVTILRGDTRVTVNLKRIHRGRAEDVPVRPGDRVVVEESPF